jgi:hypothetical protein
LIASCATTSTYEPQKTPTDPTAPEKSIVKIHSADQMLIQMEDRQKEIQLIQQDTEYRLAEFPTEAQSEVFIKINLKKYTANLTAPF